MKHKRKLIFKNFTIDLARLSKCTERKVAAIITDNDLQVYRLELTESRTADCMCVIDGKYGCIHAEINALIKCTNTEPNKVMFVTLVPCKQCATAIINAPGGFSKVYYFKEWKEDIGLQLLRNAGIHVEQL